MNTLGGTEAYTANLADLLRRRGHDARVFVSRRPVLRVWRDFFKHRRIPLCANPLPQFIRKGARDHAFLTYLHRYFRTWRPAVIHANPYSSLSLLWLSRYPNHRAPVVGTEYSLPSTYNQHWYEENLQTLINRFAAVVCKSTAASTAVREVHGYAGHIRTIRTLVRKPDRIVELSKDAHSALGCISRLDVEKGLDFLVSAMRLVVDRFPLVTLHIYGQGPDRGRLRELIRCFDLAEHVFLAGSYRPFSGIEGVSRRHCIFVQPSLFEGVPNALLEVMSRKRAFVSTDVGAVREIAGSVAAKLLVPRGDPIALAGSISALLKDFDLCQRSGEQQLRVIERHYDLEKLLQAHVDLYRSLIA